MKYTYDNDDQTWFNDNNKIHREDGPAIISSNGDEYWFLNGEPHREDGPAVEFNNGVKMWYLFGKRYTEEDFNEHQTK